MKVKELIEHLKRIDQENEVLISVRDPFSRYGNDADLFIETTRSGVTTNADTKVTRIDAHIQDEYTYEGVRKRAKVTFRK